MSQQNVYHAGLGNLSTIDGREILFTESFRDYLSEGAIHRYRAIIEIENLIALSQSGLRGFPLVSEKEKETMRSIVCRQHFDFTAVSDYDHFGRNGIGPLEHDVKAVEVYLREKFDEAGLGHLKEFIHFPMTSEDVNNLAWNLGIRDSINHIYLPKLLQVCDEFADVSYILAHVPVLGKTHGMNASPTTFGKRFAYFLGHFLNVLKQMQTLRLSGKFSGPVGNHNAMTAVRPEFDMEGYAKNFVESFGFRYEPAENQRNSHIEIVRLLNEVNLINSFAADVCENIRHQVMMGLVSQRGNESHVGSSVMPHKINPWFFEVAQGYFEQSSAMIHASEAGLIHSVFERDLTDHPWERAYGEMLGKSLVGLSYMALGMKTLHAETEKAEADLNASPEILSEAIQIMGRLEGVPNIYMVIKKLSRGQALTLPVLHQIIDEHIKDENSRETLKSLTPANYTGIASDIAFRVVHQYNQASASLRHGLLFPMAGIEAVLFDFDNTLQVGDKNELHARLLAISESLGMGFSKAQIEKFGNKSDYQKMKHEMIVADSLRVTNPVTEDEFDAANKKISGTLDHHFTLAEGAAELLQLLKQERYKVGLVTTRGVNSLPRLLAMHGITQFFNVIIDRTKVKEIKPHPQPIALALKELGVSGERAVYIGDKQLDDIIAGKALGMRTILVCTESLDEHGAVPTCHFSSLEEIKKLFLF